MKSRILTIFTVLAAAALAACGDDDLYDIRAAYEVETDTLTVFAINGSPPTAPVGLNTPFLAVVRADSSFNFDVAFDLTEHPDSVRIIPVSRVGGAFGAGRRIGIARLEQPYDSVRRAPSGGYVFDSTLVVGVGEGLAIQAVTPYCARDVSPMVFSKVIVDSVSATTREIFLRLTSDRNCGFRGLVDGVIPGS